jgi:hypothetical protein
LLKPAKLRLQHASTYAVSYVLGPADSTPHRTESRCILASVKPAISSSVLPLQTTSLDLSEKEGIDFDMTTTVRINMDKETVRHLFKTVVNATNEINETSI